MLSGHRAGAVIVALCAAAFAVPAVAGAQPVPGPHDFDDGGRTPVAKTGTTKRGAHRAEGLARKTGTGDDAVDAAAARAARMAQAVQGKGWVAAGGAALWGGCAAK